MKTVMIAFLTVITIGKLVDAIEYYRYTKGGEKNGITGCDPNTARGKGRLPNR